MADHTSIESDRLLDAADALIDVLSITPAVCLDELISREGNSFQRRVLTRMSDREIH